MLLCTVAALLRALPRGCLPVLSIDSAGGNSPAHTWRPTCLTDGQARLLLGWAALQGPAHGVEACARRHAVQRRPWLAPLVRLARHRALDVLCCSLGPLAGCSWWPLFGQTRRATWARSAGSKLHTVQDRRSTGEADLDGQVGVVLRCALHRSRAHADCKDAPCQCARKANIGHQRGLRTILDTKVLPPHPDGTCMQRPVLRSPCSRCVSRRCESGLTAPTSRR
jgi:hypothetical protein